MLRESRESMDNPIREQKEIALIRKGINLAVAGGSAVAMASGDFPLFAIPFHLLGAALAGETLGILAGSLIHEARLKKTLHS